MSDNFGEIGRNVRLLLMDCDGVMTDGRLYFSETGEAMKVFDVKDGQGLSDWHTAGFRSGIISGRGASAIIDKRASELGILYVRTNCKDKTAAFREILIEEGLKPDNAAYIGDDTGDIEVMKLAGLPIAVADAAVETKRAASYVTEARGGHGAVREVIDRLLANR